MDCGATRLATPRCALLKSESLGLTLVDTHLSSRRDAAKRAVPQWEWDPETRVFASFYAYTGRIEAGEMGHNVTAQAFANVFGRDVDVIDSETACVSSIVPSYETSKCAALPPITWVHERDTSYTAGHFLAPRHCLPCRRRKKQDADCSSFSRDVRWATRTGVPAGAAVTAAAAAPPPALAYTLLLRVVPDPDAEDNAVYRLERSSASGSGKAQQSVEVLYTVEA